MLNDSIAVSPGAIRKRADDHRAVTEGREEAMRKLPASAWDSPMSFRRTDPERWERLAEQGRQAREDDLRARGLWK